MKKIKSYLKKFISKYRIEIFLQGIWLLFLLANIIYFDQIKIDIQNSRAFNYKEIIGIITSIVNAPNDMQVEILGLRKSSFIEHFPYFFRNPKEIYLIILISYLQFTLATNMNFFILWILTFDFFILYFLYFLFQQLLYLKIFKWLLIPITGWTIRDELVYNKSLDEKKKKEISIIIKNILLEKWGEDYLKKLFKKNMEVYYSIKDM
ncbi:hypothetical protein ACA758_01410 [Mycoplasmopsis agassizii]|uniref:hypothetical protein n=1 Tax=Mycoplasmopsis agassizii TaxID=33922 RepID=UPI003527E315